METASQLLHRLTSYEPGREWDEPIDDPRVLQDFVSNDLATLPWFFKRYAPSLPTVALPRKLPTTEAPCLAVLAGSANVPPGKLDLPHLARLLHLSAGVVRTTERPYGTYLFRAAGSAGGRFPLELYVAIPEGTNLPAGVHWYHPQEHTLLQVGPAPRGSGPALIVTGVPWRTGWRYRERGFRHMYWDAGTMLAQFLALADSAGIPARLHTRFPDAAMTALVGADGMHETPLAVVALGDGHAELVPSGPAARGEVDGAPREFPLVTAAQRAGEGGTFGAAWERGGPVAIEDVSSRTVEDVVLARGSQRRMDPSRGLSASVFETSLRLTLRGIELPHFAVVHDVDGRTSGVYRWPNLSAPARAGALRDELYRVCLDQGLARDAAFVVIAAADVSRMDDREYREAQLFAGLAEGGLHLAAYALGASASGMTFLDSEIPALLGEPLDGLIFTCVGVPEYRSAKGGLPGTPTSIGRMEPRL